MLTHLPLVGFIPITDADRARKFYVDVLQLQFLADDPFAIVLQAEGAVIRLVKMEEHKPTDFTILGWQSRDIVATVQAMKTAGVLCEKFPGFDHDDLGIWTAPDREARIAWFKDTEGNLLSISQHG